MGPRLLGHDPARAGCDGCEATARPATLLAALEDRVYLAVWLSVMLAACGRLPPPPSPSGPYAPESVETFGAMAARTVPPSAQLIRIRWRYDDGGQEVSGRGAVRLAPPDSLRLDISVPVVGRATLVLAGDSTWSQPGDVAQEVPQSRAILWALFGIIHRPTGGTRIEVGDAPDRRLYRLTAPDGSVTLLECRGDTLLGATELVAGKMVGRLVLTRDHAGAVVKADAADIRHRVRFVAEVEHREASDPFPSEIWRRP